MSDKKNKLDNRIANLNELAKAYIASVGGVEEYRKFISAPNPSAPPLNLEETNSFRHLANCYDYAMNDLDCEGWPDVPVELSKDIKSVDIKSLMRGVQTDGAQFIMPEDFRQWKAAHQKNEYLIAMYIRPATNSRMPGVHFLRQDKEGGFSQNGGLGAPLNWINLAVLLPTPYAPT